MALRQRTVVSSSEANGHVGNNFGEIRGPEVKDKKTTMESGGSSWLLLACFLGIFFSYFIYGLLQERITKNKFGDERFHYFMFQVCFQCIVNCIVARTVAWYKKETLTIKPYSLFGTLTLTYVGAMVSSNAALVFISYPTQVLGKSTKPIPVLILGVLLGKRSYPLVKYICILTMVIGVALFLYKDPPNHQKHVIDDNSSLNSFKLFDTIGFGELLVFLSLTLDGLTGVIQDKLKDGHETKALQMMYGVNFYAPIYLTIALIATGEGIEALGFVSHHPEIILNLIAFSITSGIGQIFIFTTITVFGPLTCAVITTTRKFFTILASVVIFGNALLPRQWIAVVLVFVALGVDAYYSKKKSTNNQPPQTQTA